MMTMIMMMMQQFDRQLIWFCNFFVKWNTTKCFVKWNATKRETLTNETTLNKYTNFLLEKMNYLIFFVDDDERRWNLDNTVIPTSKNTQLILFKFLFWRRHISSDWQKQILKFKMLEKSKPNPHANSNGRKYRLLQKVRLCHTHLRTNHNTRNIFKMKNENFWHDTFWVTIVWCDRQKNMIKNQQAKCTTPHIKAKTTWKQHKTAMPELLHDA